MPWWIWVCLSPLIVTGIAALISIIGLFWLTMFEVIFDR